MALLPSSAATPPSVSAPPARPTLRRLVRPRLQPETCVALVWCVLAIAVGVKAVISPTRHSVWPVFAGGSNHWWAGQPLYTYYPNQDMYRYSPTFAVAVTPMAILPIRIGGCLWGAGSVVLLYVALRALHRDVLATSPNAPGRTAFLGLAVLGAAPMAWNLQSNALLLALMALGAATAARGRWWLAALFLAAPVYIKLWPLAGVALIAAWRPSRLVPRLAVTLLGLAAFPMAFTAPAKVAQAYSEWWEVLQAGQGLRWPGYRDLLTVCETARLAVPPPLYRVAQAVGGGVALLASLIAYRRATGGRTGLEIGLAAWLCWQLLLGPGSERNTYGLIVPLMGWEALRAYRTGRRWLWPGVAFVAVLLFSSGDAERTTLRWLSGAEAVLPVSVAMFAVWVGWNRLRREGPAGAEASPAQTVLGPYAVQAEQLPSRSPTDLGPRQVADTRAQPAETP